MNKGYNTKETFELLEHLRKYFNKVFLAIFSFFFSSIILLFFVIKPGPYFKSERIDLIIGICWAIIFVSLATINLLLAYNEHQSFLKNNQKNLPVYKNGAEYIKKYQSRLVSTSKSNLLFGILLFLLSSIPILNVININYYEATYYFVLLASAVILVGLSIGLFIKSILKRKNNKRISYIEVEDVNKEDDFNPKKSTINNIVSIIVYWMVTFIIYGLFGYYTDAWYSAWIILAISGLFFIIKSLIVNPFNKFRKLESKRTSVKILKLVVILLLATGIFYLMSAGSWFILPYISTTKEVEVRNLPISYIEDEGLFKITNAKDTDFKILQITDIHIGGSFITKQKDEMALQTIYKLVEYTKPDLIVITGDIVYPVFFQSFSFNNSISFFQFLTFMDNINIPWAFVYGNHDTEVFATATHQDIETNLNYYSFTKNSDNVLLYSNKDRNIYGRSNQLIEIDNYDGSINQILFLLDSNSYLSGITDNYDYIHDDQVSWYEKELKAISPNDKLASSLLFFHIPLMETKEAIDLLSNNSPLVTYMGGDWYEEVHSSEMRSLLFEKAVNLGSTKAMFYGHDHLNNVTLKYKDIILSYGMSIDYLATPGISSLSLQRGGTLITLKPDSNIKIERIKYEVIKDGNY